MPQNSFTITRDDKGRTLASFLQREFRLHWPEACEWVRSGRVSVNGKPCANPLRLLRKGHQLQVRGLPPHQGKGGKKKPATSPPQVGERNKVPSPQGRKQASRTPDLANDSGRPPTIHYLDEHIVVVDKPAGLTTVRHADEAEEFGRRARRYLPPTLADLLPDLLAGKVKKRRPPPVLAVHRLDKETSGLVVFALTKEAESHLGRQMRAHSIGRKYVALVRGRAQSGRIETHLVRDRGDGRRGSTGSPGEGKHAVTHVQLLEELGDFALVECTLETGRTHQIRIHLGERGTPLCGERLYDRPLHGRPLPDESGAARPLLHACLLEVEHPATGKRLSWSAPLPEDMKSLLQRLRRP